MPARRDRLDAVAHVMQVMAQESDWLQVTATTDLAEALDGADYVVNQVRIGGLSARAFDETFPIALGIPGEETRGPGRLRQRAAHHPAGDQADRRDSERAPEALLLSFTNPASVI